LALLARVSDAQPVPYTIAAGMFDSSNTNTLGLSAATGTETFNIFKASDASDHYGNGAAMIGFKGYLYCMWQSSPTNEDSPDTWVAYSRSQDGAIWTAPMILAANSGDGERTSGGWWANGDTLVAFINHWPTSISPRGGYTEFTTSTDGLSWTPIQRLKMSDGSFINAVFEQDPHALPGGRIINGAHFQPGLTCSPIYTDNPFGTNGWVRAAFTNLSYASGQSRELEPSWFYRNDGTVVMIFRDQNSTYFQLAASSANSGQNWTKAIVTTMPDSRAKQCAGNLADGTAFMVNNPVSTQVVKTRSPLVLTRSANGSFFDKAFVLRSGTSLPPQRYSGTSKTLGFSYPKATIWNGYLYVGYSVNKEDMECTRVPLTSIQSNAAPALAAISNRAINVGVNLSITNVATDSGLPVQTLTYTLPIAPTGASISASDGVVTWRPLVSQADSTNQFSVVVTDNGSPSMSATQSFNINVTPLIVPSMTSSLSNGQIYLTVSGVAGPDYALQGSSNLIDWTTLSITNPAVMPFNWNTNLGASPSYYYRIKVGPPLP
jgi:hypothetical protein